MTQNRYSSLVELAGYSFPVYASRGIEARAQTIAARCERAYHFFHDILNQRAKVVALILTPEHWAKYASYPIFGMPHYVDMNTLVIAGQEGEMWKMIVPPMEYLPPDTARSLRRVYGQADGSVSVAAFMDLLALHEMAHLFINQATNTVDFHLPRRWLIELFCNLCLHAYVVNKEAAETEHLTVYPQGIITLGYRHLTHTRLADFERLYGEMEPPNFAWYQCRLHVAAQRIYDSAGIEALCRLFGAIVQSSESLTDEQLAAHLQANVHPTVADVLVSWEQ
ncbi:MAG: hypothetical protein ONB46_16475 [candidate division KSB1 bacterium]|nr:hypothetical protein [candidate division KSB1 bacterium]MDZ7367248.1 hypothetical protein [candidate division KSB1 bacterium]